MTCREFRRRWDELLDADARSSAVAPAVAAAAGRPDAAPAGIDGEAALQAHAASCPACGLITARYQVLRQALRVWNQPPTPPADLVHRVLSVPEASPSDGWPLVGSWLRQLWLSDRPSHVLLRLTAILLVSSLAFAVVLDQTSRRRAHDRRMVAQHHSVDDWHSTGGSDRPSDDLRGLDRALAEATSATWDLARSASEPAARFSRDVLDATTRPEAGRAEAAGSVAPDRPSDRNGGLVMSLPSLDPLTPDPSAATAALQRVGDRLSAGVRPLSSTARQAFGFLLGTPPGRGGSRTEVSAPSGA